ncbi:MAG: hypothetical protein K9L84_04530 [Candidatus Omnitrophica bacterium]|nr:hypothetical protein [Candidatus Omnitrophota bacterium]MCF7894308.1 hypothetical protein [Candidatus Omnitrophota bacterium]
MNNILRIVFSFALFFLFSNVSYSQDYNNQQPVFPQFPTGGFGQKQGSGSSTNNLLDNLPVPYETKKVQSGLGQAYGLNMDMFSSRLSIPEVKKFYQNKLPGLGWQLMDTSGMFSSSNLNQMNVPAQTGEVARNSLIYKKGKSILVVAFYPSQGESGVIYSLTVKQVQ